MTKLYLVLPVRQANALARAATRNRKAHKAHKAHTLVLHLEAVSNQTVDGREQLTIGSLMDAIARINEDSRRAEFEAGKVDKSVAAV